MASVTRWFSMLAVVLLAAPVSAQWGGPPGGGYRGGGFGGSLDRNGNGVIEPAEFDQVDERFRGMLESSGVDMSRPIRVEEFGDVMRRRFEAMRQERGGFGGDRGSFGGDRGGYGDRGSFGRDQGREEERSSDRSSWDRSPWGGDRGWGRGGESSREDRPSSSPSSSSNAGSPSAAGRPGATAPAQRERVTLLLPSDFAAGDKDSDGQIGLYEWKQWKGYGALSEFMVKDVNNDGFLTPRELAKASPAQIAGSTSGAPPATPTAAANPATPPSGSGSSTTAAATTPPAAAPQSTPASTAPGGASAETARRYFGLMDRNHDGQISADEWNISRRIRPMFTEAGINLSEPMGVNDFVAHYVRLSETSGG